MRQREVENLFAIVVGLILAGTGCQRHNGHLEVLSGEPVGTVGHFPRIPVYAVHVGERATLRFTVGFGEADYAVSRDTGTGWVEDCGGPVGSMFEWKRTFSKATAEGSPLRLSVQAYLKGGKRDAMPIDGRLVRRSSFGDIDDLPWAGDVAAIRVYQSRFEMAVDLEGAAPDWSSTKLVIHGADMDVERRVRDAAGPGFSVAGPDAEGVWRVVYEPEAQEVRVTGRTSAELVVADVAGETRRFEAVCDTP